MEYICNMSPDDIEGEIWKPLFGFEDRAEVSNMGRFKNSRKFLGIKRQYLYKGYLNVRIWDGSKYRCLPSHRLVAKTFYGDSNLAIDHINGIKHDNRLENLEFVTFRENTTRRIIKTEKSSKYVGVSFCKKSGKWKAGIKFKGKSKSLGYYVNEIEAHQAYMDALSLISHLDT